MYDDDVEIKKVNFGAVRSTESKPAAPATVKKSEPQIKVLTPLKKAPIEETKPAEASKLVEASKPIEQPKPVETPKIVEEPKAEVNNFTTAKPAEETKPVEEIKPAEAPKPVEQPKQVETPKKVEEPKEESTLGALLAKQKAEQEAKERDERIREITRRREAEEKRAQEAKEAKLAKKQRKNNPGNKNDNAKGKKGPGYIFGRVGIIFGSTLGALVVAFIAFLLVCYYGPSRTFRNQMVLSLLETSAGDFLVEWFMPAKTIDAIKAENKVEEIDGETDKGLINIPDGSNNTFDINGIQLINISGKTYNGKLLIVNNPKRVTIGTPDVYGADKKGITTIDMVRRENALYGVNGGGFWDDGTGTGGIPTGSDNSEGIVISNGVLMWNGGGNSYKYSIIGIDKDGLLILGKMTAQEALDKGIVEAINFGPYLILNGEPCQVSGYSESSLNPRTAIGQRADGAMLILTIDGRQPTSLGASYEDLIEIMMRYGAVNAANLDGGQSTYMVQNSETENDPQIITQRAQLYDPRRMATSILVSRVESED